MNDANRELLAQFVEAEGKRLLAAPPTKPEQNEPKTIHYTELPEDTSGTETATAWNVYRREVGRLLAEGHEGRWVLIRGEDIVGIWDTEAEARTAAVERFLMQSVLIRHILTREPVLRTPFLHRCRN
jgi:hypothetical protein